MAKVNYGQTVNDARGKLGGTVFSKNRYGAFTRRKVTPINRNTPAQSLVRTNFATLSKAWSGTLTADQRAAWVSYAQTYPRLDIFGASITLSGANMYISLNQRLLQAGAALITTPPATNIVTPIAFDATSWEPETSGIATFQQTAAAAAVTLKFYVFGAKPLAPGRVAQQSDFRFVGVYAGVAGPYPNGISVGADYVAKFGAMPLGKNVAVLVSTIDTTSGLITVGTQMSNLVSTP